MYINTADYNKFTKNIIDSTKTKNLVDKAAISGFITYADLDRKVATLEIKA